MISRVITERWFDQEQRQERVVFPIAQFFMGMAITSLLIFWGSAIVGLWAAYDRTVATGRFSLLTIGLLLVVLVAWSAWRSHRQNHVSLQSITAVGLDCGLMAGGIGLLFLLTHNWQNAAVEDFTLLPQLTAWIQTQQPRWGDGIMLHENLVAGALIVLLPPAVVTLWQLLRAPEQWFRAPLRHWSVGGTLIGVGALLLTFSRGAWLGLSVGTIAAAYLYWRTDAGHKRLRAQQRAHLAQQGRFAERHARRPPTRLQRWADLLFEDPAFVDWALILAMSTGILLLIGITISPTLHELILRPIAGTYLETTINSRSTAWQESLSLIQDYPITGSGLGSTAMTLASYVYLLHVPYLYHAHSLYLQIAVEQGLLGLIGWGGMVLSCLGLGLLWLQRGTGQERLYATGALAAQVAILVYGVTDAELYVGIFVPFLFLPFALLVAGASRFIGEPSTNEDQSEKIEIAECAPHVQQSNHQQSNRQQSIVAQGVGALFPLLIVLLFFMLPGAESRWLVNRTTIGQTRQELALYQWPTWPIQDAVRRSDLVDTARWITEYEAILQTDPTNVTALRRLGQIKLSLGDYTQALLLLEAAYRQAPQQRATRQMLGEAKALLGDEAGAAALWQRIDLSQGQPELRLWWYEEAVGAEAAEHFAHFLERIWNYTKF